MSDAGDRGSGTVLALGLIGVVAVLGFFLAALGDAGAAHARATSAADLSALAGATALRHGEDGCAVASRVAARNGATVDACAVEGGGVVDVAVHCGVHEPGGRVGSWIGGRRAAAMARAGPESQR